MRSVHNEIDDSFKPILGFYTGYARFLLIVIAGFYLLMGHGLAAAAHLVVAIVMFVLFYRRHAKQESVHRHDLLPDEESEDVD